MHDINYFHDHELKEHDFLGCCFDPAPEFVECARIRPTPPVNNTSVFAFKAG